jgi:hypothetical protein
MRKIYEISYGTLPAWSPLHGRRGVRERRRPRREATPRRFAASPRPAGASRAGVAERPHFIGSILAKVAPDDRQGIMLIDGQQRVTTLTLLIAAVHKTLARDRRADGLRELLAHPSVPGQTRLRPTKDSRTC